MDYRRKITNLILLSAIALAVFLLPAPAFANQSASGFCEAGAQVVVTSGLISTTQVQASYPLCTVTVNIHGGGLATIFADNSGTVLANPFIAQTGGQWQWYAANGHYDVVLSGTGFTTPVTLSDILLNDPAAPNTLVSPTITNPTITGTVAGGATYVLPFLTSPTTTGTDIGTETLNNKSLVSPIITGTVGGGASYTSPTITGTVAGGASYTAPTLTSPVVTGTESGTRTDNGTIAFTAPNSHSGAETHSGTESFSNSLIVSGAPPTFSVATTGSDSNSCLVASPCLTLQHACLVALSYDSGGNNVVVNIGTGSFSGVELAGVMRGNQTAGFGSFLILNGNGAANTTITGFNSVFDISIDSGLLLEVQNMTISVAANQVGVFYEGPGTNLTIGAGVTFTGAASSAIAIQGEQLAYAAFGADVTFGGTFGTVINVTGLAYFDNGHKITCSSLTITTFISVSADSYAQFDASASFSGCGAVSGVPYSVSGNSFISNGTTALPGTSSGTIFSGGRYRPSPAPTIGSATGLGSGGSPGAAVVSGSSSLGGLVTLTTGSSSTAATGTVAIVFNESATTVSGAYLPCIAAISDTGATSWNSQAVVAIGSASVGNLSIAWSNNAVALTTSTTYQIAWNCSGN